MNYINIFIFGDSISLGKYDTQGGWATRLKKHCDFTNMHKPRDNYINLFNLSIPGNNSDRLLKQVDFEMKQRLHKNTKNIVLIAIGINDLTKDTLTANLRRIIITTKKYSEDIYLIKYFNDDSVILKVSEIMKTNYIDASILKSKRSNYMYNNKHPNSHGHKKIYNKILRSIKTSL